MGSNQIKFLEIVDKLISGSNELIVKRTVVFVGVWLQTKPC